MPAAPALSTARYVPVPFTLETPGAEPFHPSDVAPELGDLTGIRVPAAGGRLEFTLPEPAQILVGFFPNSRRTPAASPPKDEWNPVLFNAKIAQPDLRDFSSMIVYAHELPAGRNDLDFGKGAYVVLGFVKQNTRLEPRMIASPGGRASLDWLFE